MKTLHVVGGALLRDGRCLVAQRSEHMSMPLKWEFPGGKVEVGETPEAALVRELHEELGVEAEVDGYLGRGESANVARHIVLDVYAARLVRGEPHPREHARVRWVGADELLRLDWPEADYPVLDALRDRLLRG